MSCMNDCLSRDYVYGPPTNIRTLDTATHEFTPVPKSVVNYKELVSRAQAIIDAKDKTKDNCEKGCICVRDKKQDKPYPKESEERTESEWIGQSFIKFDYTVKFTTYTGQCDDKAPGYVPEPPPKDSKKK